MARNKSRLQGSLGVTLAICAALLLGAASAALAVGNTVDVTGTGCLSNAYSCVSGIPVSLNKGDATPVRGYSVTITLTNLRLCAGLSSIHRGTYLGGAAVADYHVRPIAPGVYTIDEVILGPATEPTASGVLFTLDVADSVVSDGVGTVSVSGIKVRDTNNVTIPTSAGSSASLTIDHTPPVAISDLAAAQQLTGNPSGQVTNIALTYSPVEAGATVTLYRAGFGNYPTYAGGSVPSAAAAPGGPWSSIGAQASGYNDLPGSRDFYYYVAFVTDACGNVSLVSNETGGTLNYHLGDVTDGITAGTGDNSVDVADVSALGGSYGLSGGAVTPVAFLDFGPTGSGSVLDRPTPDASIDFEDLILLAINYSVVSKPMVLAPAETDQLAVNVTGGVHAGDLLSADLLFQGTGRIQGLSAQLKWNPAVVQPMGASAGALLQQLNGVALSPRSGAVDVAALGVRDRALAGVGTLASVAFRRIAEGDAGIALSKVDARDALNRKFDLATGKVIGSPSINSLSAARPNPFRSGTSLEYSIRIGGSVDLAIYSVVGQRIRTLAAGSIPAGRHTVSWDGLDQNGHRAAPGVYYARLRTAEGTFTRTLAMVQ